MAKVPAAERDKRIKVIEDILSKAMPQMPKLRFSASRSGELRLEGSFDIGRPRAKHLQDQLSDGTLTAFVILWSFLDEGPVLLLEKPETALNHETIRRMGLIMHMSSVMGKKKKQLIMSTHGADFLRDYVVPVKPEEIIILMHSNYKEGTKAFQASSFPPIISDIKKGMSVDEIILDYTHPNDAMEMLLDFMGLDIDLDSKG